MTALSDHGPAAEGVLRLGDLLRERGLTVRETARRSGVGRNTLYSWLHGRTTVPAPHVVERVADTLGVAPADLHPSYRPAAASLVRSGSAAAAPHRATSPSAVALGQLLDRRGWSTRRLAEALGVGHSTVNNWVAGRRGIRPDLAGRAAAVLGVDLEQVDPALAHATPLARELASRGLTARDVARRAGLPEELLSGWLNGHSRPSRASVQRLTSVLGADVADLFPDTSSRSRATAAAAAAAGLPSLDAVLDLPATNDPDWQKDAACAESMLDPEAWWPTAEADPTLDARKTCAACPVTGDCRDAFLADPAQHRYGADGIWAGHRGRDLLRAHRHRAATRTTPAGQVRRTAVHGRSR